MTKVEWNQVFAWLTGIYPQWKPESGVSAAWFDEVGRKVDQNTFRAAVRICGAKRPSSFAPGVFEILNEVNSARNGGEPKELAEKVWMKVLAVSKDYHRGEKIPQMSGPTRKALRLIGGFRGIGDCQESELKWLQKRFVEAWVVARQNEERAVLMGLKPSEPKKIDDRVSKIISDSVKTIESKRGDFDK